MSKEEKESEQSEEVEQLSDSMKQVLRGITGDPLKVMAGLAQIEKHSGERIILSVPNDDHPRMRALEKFSVWWFRDDSASTPYHISCAVEEFMTAITNPEQPHIDELLRAVRTTYKSVEALPIRGKNRYDSDKSVVDGRYIRRQRR